MRRVLRVLATLGLLAAAAAAQSTEPIEDALARKCDSEIPWIRDGVELADGTPKPPEPGAAKRAELLEQAKKAAREKNRLILWYCPRIPGTHMYRAPVLDHYAKVVFFTDPGVVDLIRSKFVPLRMSCDETVAGSVGLRKPDFIEPGFLFLTPEGRVVHTMDRIRTFNADWLRAALIAVLRRNDAYNAPAGESVEDLIRGGDDEKALERATPDQKAQIFRHAGRYRDVLGLSCAALQKGRALLALGDLDGARRALDADDSPESLYHRAAIAQNPDAIWKQLLERHPESCWAWRAAAQKALDPDGLPRGPMSHLFEDFSAAPPKGLVSTTGVAAATAEAASRRALDFLLRAQRDDGSWSDARYCYGWASYMIKRHIKEGRLDPSYRVWPDTTLRPNFYIAVTALSALALAEWRDAAPERVDLALRKAEAYLDDDARVATGRCEECYAEMFRLLYYTKSKDVPRMNRILSRLGKLQDEDGFWGHEYPSAFATAARAAARLPARAGQAPELGEELRRPHGARRTGAPRMRPRLDRERRRRRGRLLEARGGPRGDPGLRQPRRRRAGGLFLLLLRLPHPRGGARARRAGARAASREVPCPDAGAARDGRELRRQPRAGEELRHGDGAADPEPAPLVLADLEVDAALDRALPGVGQEALGLWGELVQLHGKSVRGRLAFLLVLRSPSECRPRVICPRVERLLVFRGIAGFQARVLPFQIPAFLEGQRVDLDARAGRDHPEPLLVHRDRAEECDLIRRHHEMNRLGAGEDFRLRVFVQGPVAQVDGDGEVLDVPETDAHGDGLPGSVGRLVGRDLHLEGGATETLDDFPDGVAGTEADFGIRGVPFEGLEGFQRRPAEGDEILGGTLANDGIGATQVDPQFRDPLLLRLAHEKDSYGGEKNHVVIPYEAGGAVIEQSSRRMRWMQSQSWKPVVYLSTTIGAVVVVLALVYTAAKLLIPGFSVLGIRRGEGRLLVGIAGALAYGSVLLTTRLLKRYWGREFGNYLDDPDQETAELRATKTTICRRCGTPFPVYSNDAHAAGFCSQACQSRGA